MNGTLEMMISLGKAHSEQFAVPDTSRDQSLDTFIWENNQLGTCVLTS